MKLHELKIKDKYYEDIVCGYKKAELRKNDRDYQVGDLIQFIPERKDRIFWGNAVYQITHILKDVPEYGLADGYCILSIERLK